MKQRVLKATGVRGLSNLTENKIYITLRGIEAGIFIDRPFVSIIDDNGKGYSCHYSRFDCIARKRIKRLKKIKELKEKE